MYLACGWVVYRYQYLSAALQCLCQKSVSGEKRRHLLLQSLDLNWDLISEENYETRTNKEDIACFFPNVSVFDLWRLRRKRFLPQKTETKRKKKKNHFVTLVGIKKNEEEESREQSNHQKITHFVTRSFIHSSCTSVLSVFLPIFHFSPLKI